jgi:hypothetical protein
MYIFNKNLKQNIIHKNDVVCCEYANIPTAGILWRIVCKCFHVETLKFR